jgi:hypothetical protein
MKAESLAARDRIFFVPETGGGCSRAFLSLLVTSSTTEEQSEQSEQRSGAQGRALARPVYGLS